MKTINKALSFVTLLLMTGIASAASLQDLQVAELAKQQVAKITAYNDAVAFNIKYIGSSTQAIVNVSTGAFKVFVPGPDGTADINYNLASVSYSSMGALCDAINAESYYSCALVDAKRDDLSILLRSETSVNSSTYSAKETAGFDVKIDSGGIASTFVNGTQFELRLGITPQSGKKVVLKHCIAAASGTADVLKVWGKLDKYSGVSDGVTRDDSTVVISTITAEDANAELGSSAMLPYLQFAKDAHVVVGTSDNDTAQTVNNNFVECWWDEK